MNLSWIDDFLALAASGNFSRAAEERHMTQPAFSRRVRALEAWLGAELFDRRSQPATLTEAGRWFREAAPALQAQVARLPGEARAVAEAGAATLRFAATHALSFNFLPGWLRALESHTPLGPVQLVSDVQARCESLLLQRQVQFVLSHGHAGVAGPLDEARCPSLVVGADRLRPVSAPAADGGASRAPLHRLKRGVPLLDYSAESGLGRILHSLKGSALAKLPTAPVMTAHLASVLRSMALQGRGLAWLPELLIADDLATGRLLPAADEGWDIALEVRLHRDTAAQAPAAQAFWEAAGRAAAQR